VGGDELGTMGALTAELSSPGWRCWRWHSGSSAMVNATTVALIVIALMLVTDIVRWDEMP
jgi:di/tricarboxylate transporter